MSRNQIDVHVNREPTQSLEVSEPALSVHESVDLVLHGHGQPAHVHCRLEGALADVASIDETNHYVEGHERTVVPVTLSAADDAVSGSIVVTSGYGMLEETVEVSVEPDSSPVLVDESLASPSADGGKGLFERVPARVVGLVLVAVLGVAVAGVMGSSVGGFLGLVLFVVATLVIAGVTGSVLTARG
ncbi:MAG: hypothetical protein U5K37_05900 [Natrialbaceae archaeon]|nr:hypothetical protein [Natrialbaceae archaeon]